MLRDVCKWVYACIERFELLASMGHFWSHIQKVLPWQVMQQRPLYDNVLYVLKGLGFGVDPYLDGGRNGAFITWEDPRIEGTRYLYVAASRVPYPRPHSYQVLPFE